MIYTLIFTKIHWYTLVVNSSPGEFSQQCMHRHKRLQWNLLQVSINRIIISGISGDKIIISGISGKNFFCRWFGKKLKLQIIWTVGVNLEKHIPPFPCQNIQFHSFSLQLKFLSPAQANAKQQEEQPVGLVPLPLGFAVFSGFAIFSFLHYNYL